MATIQKRTTALKAALLGYLAGGHYIIEEVARNTNLTATSNLDIEDSHHGMLEADYERLQGAEQGFLLLAEMLNEEALYPFGENWPSEAFSDLATKIRPPSLSFLGHVDEENVGIFGYKVGFKQLLHTYAEALEDVSGGGLKPSSLDHWLVAILNTAFYAGTVITAQLAEDRALFYDVLTTIESADLELWSTYPQLAHMLEKRLQKETKRKGSFHQEQEWD